MWSKIKDTLKELFIKIKCYMCCRSNCVIQVGREEHSQPQICETSV